MNGNRHAALWYRKGLEHAVKVATGVRDTLDAFEKTSDATVVQQVIQAIENELRRLETHDAPEK